MQNTILVFFVTLTFSFCILEETTASHNWDDSILIDGTNHKHEDSIYRLYVCQPSDRPLLYEINDMKSLPDFNPIPDNFDLSYLFDSKIEQIKTIMTENPDYMPFKEDNRLIIYSNSSYKYYVLQAIDLNIFYHNSNYTFEDAYSSIKYHPLGNESNWEGYYGTSGVQFFFLYQTEPSNYSYSDSYFEEQDKFSFGDFLKDVGDFFNELGISPYILATVSVLLLSIKYRRKIFGRLSPSQKY